MAKRRPLSSFTILHLTDIHLGQGGKYEEHQQECFSRMLSSLPECHSGKDPIDFVVVTGDIIESSLPCDAQLRNIKYFFNSLMKDLLHRIALRPEHVIIVPGNHDQSNLAYFMQLCAEKGFSSGKYDTGQFQPFHVSFWPQYDISFTLFNSGDKSPSIDYTSQLRSIEDSVAKTRDANIPSIAVFHHHLLPLPLDYNGPIIQRDDILTNASQVFYWLMKNRYFAVLCGHMHRSCFLKHIPYQLTPVKAEGKYSEQGERGIYIVAGGSFGASYKPVGTESTYNYLQVDTRSDMGSPAIRIRQSRFVRENWCSPVEAGSPDSRTQFDEVVCHSEGFVNCSVNRAGHSEVFRIPDKKPQDGSVAVIMPFRAEFDRTYDAIKNACVLIGSACFRADDIWENTTFIQDIVDLICCSKVVVVDLTGKNPNVIYETGIAHTLGKHVIPITQVIDDVPSDLRHHRVLKYLPNSEGYMTLQSQLARRIRTIIQGD